MLPVDFEEAVKALSESLGSDSEVQDFLQSYPLEEIARHLSAPGVSAAVVEDAAAAFAKIFATAHGASLLPTIPPFAAAALQSPTVPLRRLAVEQLGRLVAAQEQPPADCLDLLLSALRNADVGVATAAEAALRQLGRPQAGAQAHLALLLQENNPFGSALAALASCNDPLLRMRSLTLAVGIASQSAPAAEAVRRSGLLEPLLAELQDPDDLLSCMAALQLISEAGERCDAGMAAALCHEALPMLTGLLGHAEPVVQGGALRAAASLLSAALEAGVGPMVVDGAVPHQAQNGVDGATLHMANGVDGAAHNMANGMNGVGGQAGAQPLLAALKAVLDVGSDEKVAQELEEAALDAVSTLGLHCAGAEVMLTEGGGVVGDVAYKALGRPSSPAQRIAALHAVAAVAGAERSGRSGKLLSHEAEAALRVSVFEGAAAAWPGATPADVLQQQLEQPFLQQRVAVYRCLAALAARAWAAGLVCASPPLLTFLLDPQSESSKQGCEWRHACVAALAATIDDVAAGGMGAGGPHQAALEAAAEKVQAAVRAGPYGAASIGPMEHQVATMPV